MARLNGVTRLGNGVIKFNGKEYTEVSNLNSIKEGYIVENIAEETGDITIGCFYEVTDVAFGEFTIKDDVGDERDRDCGDSDYAVYAPSQTTSSDNVQEIVINSPVRLVLNGPVTIEIKSEAKFQ